MDDDSHVQPMLHAVMECLEARHVRYAQFVDIPVIVFPCHTSTAVYSCTVEIHPNRPLLRCMLPLCCRAPQEKRQATAELLARINCGTLIGHFEMSFADGGIRFRTDLDLTGAELVAAMVDSALCATIETVDCYHPAIMSFLWNDIAPEDAVAMIEEASPE